MLDVRPQVEFAAGHVAGAVDIPAQDLAEQLRQSPDGKRASA